MYLAANFSDKSESWAGTSSHSPWTGFVGGGQLFLVEINQENYRREFRRLLAGFRFLAPEFINPVESIGILFFEFIPKREVCQIRILRKFLLVDPPGLFMRKDESEKCQIQILYLSHPP